MEINSQTKIGDLLKEYPFLKDFLINYNVHFGLLKNKAFMMTMGRIATLEKAADMVGISLENLINDIKTEIKKSSGRTYRAKSSIKKDKIERLKKIIRKLHKNEDADSAKKEFNKLVKEIDPGDLVKMEEELIEEGMPVTEVQRLCDLHHAVVSEGLMPAVMPEIPPGHPVHTYKAENVEISRLAEQLNKDIRLLIDKKNKKSGYKAVEKAKETLKELKKIELHYLRKENQLFPFLEKKGFTGPSQVMWAIHDEVRATLKRMPSILDSGDVDKIKSSASSLTRTIIEMIAKENSILFPMAMEKLTDDEWLEIYKGESAIGYAYVTPGEEWKPLKAAAVSASPKTKSNELQLNTGRLTLEQMDSILTSLPIDLSFVDENDEVKYYTESRERIFPRSPGVIGRNVEKCHPPKSVHIVRRILDEFKAGTKNEAEFWINLNGRFIHIRYFPIRNKDGKYLGTLEFTQDVTEIRKLEGERRLLNWDEENKTT